MSNSNPIKGGGSLESLKAFQIENLSIKEKSDWEWGKSLAQGIESTINGGTSSYFWIRNGRWRQNRNYANGRISMDRFMDLLEFNGKVNYTNLSWQCIHIVNRIVSGLVGRWMNRNEKIQVTATDSLSTKEKERQYEELEFFIENREMLMQLQEQSGEQMLPKDESLPTSKEDLLMWKSQFQRLPEEIAYEMACNEILASCGWFDVLKEKALHDSAETGFIATETYMDDDGVIHIDWLKPENCFYSYSDFPDFRDTTWRGVLKTMKISELRRKYGVEFGGKLTEEQLWNIAQTAKEYQLYDNITWLTNWNVTFLRPYDEWNVTVLEFEVKTVDSQPYTVTTTKKNKSTIIRKGKPERVLDENEKIVEDTKVNIYRGVYERTNKVMLEWGLKKNMIRPQDPKEIGNAEFSYSFYMVQNYDMTSLAVPEKIQEPADQMIIARLKMQQLVAKMRPTGSAVNWDALQNIDFGLGDQNKGIDVKKLYDQTGDIYYRGRDAEGNQIPVPITELQNSGFLAQLQGLILLYDKHYQIMKDELGEDPNLITQAAQPRVAVSNIETSQQQAAFATDYFYSGFVRVIEDSCKKASCLLKTSVTYGAKAYRKMLKEDDVAGRMFGTKIQLLPDEIQIAKFEAMMNASLAANQELVLFINPFQLMRIAKEDVKLAEQVFNQGQKRMLQTRQAEAVQNQQANIQGQMASAKSAELEKRKTEAEKSKMDLLKTITQGDSQSKNTVLAGIMAIYLENAKTGGTMPAELQSVAKIALENVAIPAMVENEEQKLKILSEIDKIMQEGEEMEQPKKKVWQKFPNNKNKQLKIISQWQYQ